MSEEENKPLKPEAADLRDGNLPHDDVEDFGSVATPDMSGEVMDPVFDDTAPLKMSSEYMPDPSFEDAAPKSRKRRLSSQELSELSATVPEGVDLDAESAQDMPDPKDYKSTTVVDAPKNPFYQEDADASDEPDIRVSTDLEDAAVVGADQDKSVGRDKPVVFSIEDDMSGGDSFSDMADEQIEADVLGKDEDSDLTDKDPALKNILVGVGWDLNNFDGEPVDLDLSCFLLDKDNMTRVDTDFVFYNNLKGADLAVQHSGDDRAGVGVGDDETISLDLEALPFDIWQVAFVVTVYVGDDERDHTFGMVNNAYIRIVNKDTKAVLARYDLDTEFAEGTCLRFGELLREGGKWKFHARGEFEEGGLSKIAQSYGLLISGT